MFPQAQPQFNLHGQTVVAAATGYTRVSRALKDDRLVNKHVSGSVFSTIYNWP